MSKVLARNESVQAQIAEKGIDPKYKEAYAFALLAASNYFNVAINAKYITGAVEPYIIGETALWR